MSWNFCVPDRDSGGTVSVRTIPPNIIYLNFFKKNKDSNNI